MRRTLLSVDSVALILSSLYLWGALGYRRGTMDQPGPGLYPLYVGVLLVVASIGSIVTDLVNPARRAGNPKGEGPWAHVDGIGGGGGLCASPSLCRSSAVCDHARFYRFACDGLGVMADEDRVTIGIALGSYYLFDILLMVPLPKGFLG